MKIKWKMLLLGVTVALLATSCGVFKRIGAIGRKVPDPVFLESGDVAPYTGWLVDERLLKDVTKEAYRQ